MHCGHVYIGCLFIAPSPFLLTSPPWDPLKYSIGPPILKVGWKKKHKKLGYQSKFVPLFLCCPSGHPKTKVLVNHGGTSTVLEAIYHGVPMVLIPLANDMFDITTRAVCRGVAVRLDMPTLTGHALKDALQRLLTDPRYSVLRPLQ